MFGEVGKLAGDCPRAPPSLAQLKFKAESKITLDTVSAGRGQVKKKSIPKPLFWLHPYTSLGLLKEALKKFFKSHHN